MVLLAEGWDKYVLSYSSIYSGDINYSLHFLRNVIHVLIYRSLCKLNVSRGFKDNCNCIDHYHTEENLSYYN